MKRLWGVVLGVGLWSGCAVEDGPEVPPPEEVPEVEQPAPPPEVPEAPVVEEPNAIDGPGLVVETQRATFAQAWVGHETSTTVQLRNTGTAPLKVELSATPPFAVDGAAVDLAPGATHTAKVRVTPASAGTLEGTLKVSAGGRTVDVALTAQAQVPPDCESQGRCVHPIFDPKAGTCVGVPKPDCEEPQPEPRVKCSGPDGTARQEWSYEAQWDQSVDFRGIMDVDGHTYWTECDSSYWSNKEPNEFVCHLVSASYGGSVRYKLQLPQGYLGAAVHSVDAGQLYLTAGSTVSARARADGREVWATALAELLPEEERNGHRIDFVVHSPPYLVTVLHVPFAEAGTTDLLVALRADTGEVAWHVRTVPIAKPLVVDAEGNLYGGSYDEASQGTTLFSYTAEGQRRWMTSRAGDLVPTAVDGGTLVLGRTQLADASTGTARATLGSASANTPDYVFGRSVSPHGRAALQAGKVLILPEQQCTGPGCPDTLPDSRTFLYGLDPDTGAVRWYQPVGTWPMAPLLTRRDSVLWVDRAVDESCVEYGCSWDDSYALSSLRELSLDGRELSVCTLPGNAPYITPPALRGGRVVLGAWTNWNASNDWSSRISIRAFSLGTSTEPANQGWVSAGGGNRRSGTPVPQP